MMPSLLQRYFVGLIFTLFLLCPVFAENAADDDTGKDDTQIFRVLEGIDLISSVKYQYGKKPALFIKNVYPLLQSNNANEPVDHFNELVTQLIVKEIARFKNDVRQAQALQKTLPKKLNKNNLYIDYDAATITSGDNHLISIRFTLQQFIGGMAHPSHTHAILNYDLDTGEEIELNDLFQTNSNYLNVLSDYTKQQLLRRMPNNAQMITEGTAPISANFSVWNIRSHGLLFTFSEDQVAPRVNGSQSILVPYSVLKSVLSPDAVIESCVSHHKKCTSNADNLLTGGFIDEA